MIEMLIFRELEWLRDLLNNAIQMSRVVQVTRAITTCFTKRCFRCIWRVMSCTSLSTRTCDQTIWRGSKTKRQKKVTDSVYWFIKCFDEKLQIVVSRSTVVQYALLPCLCTNYESDRSFHQNFVSLTLVLLNFLQKCCFLPLNHFFWP